MLHRYLDPPLQPLVQTNKQSLNWTWFIVTLHLCFRYWAFWACTKGVLFISLRHREHRTALSHSDLSFYLTNYVPEVLLHMWYHDQIWYWKLFVWYFYCWIRLLGYFNSSVILQFALILLWFLKSISCLHKNSTQWYTCYHVYSMPYPPAKCGLHLLIYTQYSLFITMTTPIRG